MSQSYLEGFVRVEPVSGTAAAEDDILGRSISAQLDRAYRLAWAILGNDVEAQDATQEAFMKAWHGRSGLRDPERVEAWLGRILINVCRDKLRARGRNRTVPADLPVLLSPSDYAAEVSTRDELDRAIAALDPDHRIVVILRFWADLTVGDIAERLGVPAGTVKSRLNKAMRTLRSSLEETK